MPADHAFTLHKYHRQTDIGIGDRGGSSPKHRRQRRLLPQNSRKIFLVNIVQNSGIL